MEDPKIPDSVLLLQRAKDFFKSEILTSHEAALKRASALIDYNVHPFLFKYIANFLEGNSEPRSIAKALIYPRILGTSITTIFGMRAQKMINVLFEGMGSAIPGIDIEFIDGLDGRKKYCQLKSGPSNINSADVKTIKDHFSGIKNIARVNNLDLRISDMVVGVLYGEHDDLMAHYIEIERDYPVYAGKLFWHHLTGKEDFYFELIAAIGEIALEVDGREKLEEAITLLANEIEESDF